MFSRVCRASVPGEGKESNDFIALVDVWHIYILSAPVMSASHVLIASVGVSCLLKYI